MPKIANRSLRLTLTLSMLLPLLVGCETLDGWLTVIAPRQQAPAIPVALQEEPPEDGHFLGRLKSFFGLLPKTPTATSPNSGSVEVMP